MDEPQCITKRKKEGAQCKEEKIEIFHRGNLFLRECEGGACVTPKNGNSGKCPSLCIFGGFKCFGPKIVSCEDGVEKFRLCQQGQQCLNYKGKAYCGDQCIYTGKKFANNAT